MLNVYLGSLAEAKSNISGYFDVHFTNDWLNNDFAKAVIKDIDKSEHIKDSLIESPFLGAIAPTWLSSGCKALISIYNNPDLIVCGERFGDNCFKWLFELSKTREIKISLSHIPHLDYTFDMKILNSGVIVHDFNSFMAELMSCRRKDLIKYA